MSPVTNYPATTWVRARNGMIAGVCEGVARRLQVESWLVRFVLVMAVLFGGTGLLAYLVLAVSLPREDRVDEAYDKMILGVCSRLARRSNVEIGVVRAGAALAACVTFGAAVIAYVALYFLLPDPGSQTKPNALN